MDIFVSWSSDTFSRKQAAAAASGDAAALRQLSADAEHGTNIFRSWVEASGGSVITFGGDEGRAQVPVGQMEGLQGVRARYESCMGGPSTVGIGTKLLEADRALLAGKLKGGDRVVLWTEQVEEELRAQKGPEAVAKAEGASPVSPEMSSPALAQGAGNAGMKGPHEPAAPQAPAKPVVEGSEHSQGEAAANFADENHVSPETTHAGQDLEEQFHEAAQEDDEGKPAGEDAHVLQHRVVQVLQEIKSQAKVIAQLKEAAPEAYKAVMDLVTEMIKIARAGGVGGKPAPKDDVKKSERKTKCEAGQAWNATQVKKSESSALLEKALNGYSEESKKWPRVRCPECGDSVPLTPKGWLLRHYRPGVIVNTKPQECPHTKILTPEQKQQIVKSEGPAFTEAAFLHKPSGVVYPSGAFHDIDKLPTEYCDEYLDGFLTHDGKFLSREAAAEALHRPEGKDLQSEDLELSKAEGEPLKVYRIENAKGEGPYKAGAIKQVEDESQPPAHTDFDPEVFAAMDEHGYQFGFENPSQAIDWFGGKTFKALKVKGFTLKQVDAKQVWDSKSGTQVIYEPVEAMKKTSLPMPHAPGRTNIRWPIGALDTKTQRIKVQHHDGVSPAKPGWKEVQAGQVLDQNPSEVASGVSHVASSRAPTAR